MKKAILILLCLTVVLSASGCKALNGKTGSATDNTQNAEGTVTVTEDIEVKDAEEEKVEISGDFLISGDTVVPCADGVYTVSAAGEYTLSGNLSDGRIVVDVAEGEVTLILSGASLTSAKNAPIAALNADKVTVKSAEDTYNEITDGRTLKSTDDETQYAGAVYAACDLSLTGKGSLVVTAGYNNGVHTKDDLKIKNVTLKVKAPNNALKGNDSVTVESGNIVLISTGGDGIKTENTDVSSKGNQRGSVTLSGGNIQIYAAADGIDAAYDVTVGADVALGIKTATYSEYSEEVLASSGTDLYLIVPTANYKESNTYAVYFYNGEETGVWRTAAYETMVSSGRTSYYGLLLEAPSGYQNVKFFIFPSGTTPSLTSYTAASGGQTMNTSMNAFLLSVSGSSLSGDWVNLSRNTGGGPGGGPGGQSAQSDKTEYSSKGIKAGNAITVNGGVISISAMDDGLHANYGTALENGEKSLGNVTVNGGTLEIVSADDGIHADSVVTVAGGYLNVKKSHEGVEGNTILFSGGETYIYANDDGVNAASGVKSPSITVSGGYLDVTTASGDTDGIDSNGTYTQTGGFVLIKGGSSSGNVSGSLDTDGTVSVTGGTIIALGGICELPNSSSKPVVRMQRKSFSAGTYTLSVKNGADIRTFTLTSGYSSCWICSDAFSTGSGYVLKKDGASFASWTQSSQSVSVS